MWPVLKKMTGTDDRSLIDPTSDPSAGLEVFNALPTGGKFELVLKDETHFAFSDSNRLVDRKNPAYHPAIQMISLKYWDAYLKNSADAKAWLKSMAPIRDTGLGADDRWQWKD